MNHKILGWQNILVLPALSVPKGYKRLLSSEKQCLSWLFPNQNNFSVTEKNLQRSDIWGFKLQIILKKLELSCRGRVILCTQGLLVLVRRDAGDTRWWQQRCKQRWPNNVISFAILFQISFLVELEWMAEWEPPGELSFTFCILTAPSQSTIAMQVIIIHRERLCL